MTKVLSGDGKRKCGHDELFKKRQHKGMYEVGCEGSFGFLKGRPERGTRMFEAQSWEEYGVWRRLAPAVLGDLSAFRNEKEQQWRADGGAAPASLVALSPSAKL